MNDFLIVLWAISLSGSILFLVVKIYDRIFSNQVQAGKLYLLLKVSLLYFFLPGIFMTITLIKLYSYEINSQSALEVHQFFVYKHAGSIAVDRLFHIEVFVVNLIFVVWLIGAIVAIFIINLYKGYISSRLLGTCFLPEDCIAIEILKGLVPQYKIKRKIALYQCSHISSPILFGILKPKIIIPVTDFSEEELEIIFRHELTHYKNHDIFFRGLIGIIHGMNWFNPVMIHFSSLFYDYGELACDEKVAAQLTAAQRVIYARLLCRLLEKNEISTNKPAFSNNDENFLKRRVFIIIKGTKIKKTVISSVLAYSLVCLWYPLCSFASYWSASQVYNEIMTNVVSENSEKKVYNKQVYVEYHDNTELPSDLHTINSSTKGVNSIDLTFAAGSVGVTNEFTATTGKGIKVIVSGDSSSASFKAGVVDSSGYRRYVTSRGGSVDCTFEITETGTYGVYFENDGNSDLHLLGTIYIDY